MKHAIVPERPLFITEKSRDQVTKFLAELMEAVQVREWENSARLSAFGMTTLLGAHFPELMLILDECLVRDTDCLEATVNVDRFLFHLTSLKVSEVRLFYSSGFSFAALLLLAIIKIF